MVKQRATSGKKQTRLNYVPHLTHHRFFLFNLSPFFNITSLHRLEAERQRKLHEAQAAEAARRNDRKHRLKMAREERRAMREMADERIGAISAPGTAAGDDDDNTGSTSTVAQTPATVNGSQSQSPVAETRAERLRRLAAARAASTSAANGTAAGPTPSTAASAATSVTAAPAGETRAERLRRLAAARAAKREQEEQASAPPPTTATTTGPTPPKLNPFAAAPAAAAAAARSAAPAPPGANPFGKAAVTQMAVSPPPQAPVESTPAVPASASPPASDPVAAEAVAEAVAEETPLEKAIALLESRIEELMAVTDQHKSGFANEFLVLDREDRARFKSEPTTAGRLHEEHNRYSDIVPYDETRVVLGTPGENADDDYINASHMNGLLPGSPNFICAQGPNVQSIGHFWKMVVQQHARVIVMVTNLVEKGREKCEQYWPDLNQSKSFGRNGAGNAVQVFCKEESKGQGWYVLFSGHGRKQRVLNRHGNLFGRGGGTRA